MTQSGPASVAVPSGPVTPVAMVRRARLLARLDAARDVKVITLVAPGGFGKSTLLSQWLADSDRRIVWLSVPTGSDSRDVAERIAVELASGPMTGSAQLPVVQDDALWFSVVLPALENVLSRQPRKFVLVLDDSMNFSDRLSDSLIDRVAAAVPDGSQLVLCTRGAPPHAVRRLRPTGRTLELNTADLAMDDDEARLLLEELTVHLPADQLEQVVLRTEGWPVGIYLLGRAVLNAPDLLATDGVPLATTEWIYDYIRDELFAELDPADATFLMKVSVLDDLTGPVCDAVAGATGSLVRLRELAAENQLIRRTSGDGVSYRLHQLFADFLRDELRGQPALAFEQTHARAAQWFLEQGQHEQVVSHLRQTGDDTALGDFIWAQAWRLLSRGQMPVLRRWIADIEDDRIARHPGLCLSAVWIGIHESDIAKVHHHAAIARHLVERTDPQGDHASNVAIAEAVIGAEGLESIIARTTEAIDARDPLDPWMSLAFFMRGVAQLHFDHTNEGVSDLVEGYRISEALDITHMRAHCLAGQGVARLAQGDNQAAGELIARAREIVFDNNLEHIPAGAPIFTASALVLLETGQRADAAADAARALRLTALFEPIAPWHAVEGRLRLAQVYRQLGDPDRAQVLTTEARDRYTPAAHSPLLDGMLAEAEAQLEQSNGTAPLPSLLTTAELRVVQYLPSHLTFPEIGEQLWLSRHTVKSQAMSAYRKLGVTSRSEAVVRARELGLLPAR